MSAEELRILIFELLFERLQVAEDPTQGFVGLQGDLVVVLQPGGKHLAVTVQEAMV